MIVSHHYVKKEQDNLFNNTVVLFCKPFHSTKSLLFVIEYESNILTYTNNNKKNNSVRWITRLVIR